MNSGKRMKIKVCRTLKSQSRGLMFSRRKNLLFIYNIPVYIDLHMLFVFFPVDAIYINENMEIIEIKHMKPFGWSYKAKHKAKYVLEVTEEHDFNVWDKVEINDNEVSKAM